MAETYLGNPCKRGHEPVRYVSNGSCVACISEQNAARYKVNADRLKEYSNQYYHANRVECRERNKKWQANNVEYLQAYRKSYRDRNKGE